MCDMQSAYWALAPADGLSGPEPAESVFGRSEAWKMGGKG